MTSVVRVRSAIPGLRVALAAVALCATSAHGKRALAQAGPKPPSALTVVSASKNAVSLSWTAGDPAVTRYAVERRPLGAAWPAAPLPPPGAPAPASMTTLVDRPQHNDQKIDAFTTYVYRVRAAGAAEAFSAPSNEVTIGPPPIGFSQVVADPGALTLPNQFAHEIGVTLDANGDPALAYLIVDPNNDNNASDTTLQFVSWNRARYRWNTPVQVATVGAINLNGARAGVGLARDASSNRFGIAHLVGEHEVRIALSDDNGATWKSARVAATGGAELGSASLGLASGQAFVAYAQQNEGLRVAIGAQTDPPDKWKTTTAPKAAGTSSLRPDGVSLALDRGGRPGVVYWLNSDEGYNVTLAFWVPGQTRAAKISDTANHQTDDVDARLTFSGTQAAVVFHAMRDDEYYNGQHQIWFTRSTDGGATWAPPVPLPADGGQSMGPKVSIALDTQGRPAVTAQVTGGNTTGTRCGQPKLMRSADGVKWTTCAPEAKGTGSGSTDFPVALFAANDKLYVAFAARADAGELKAGVILWREQ